MVEWIEFNELKDFKRKTKIFEVINKSTKYYLGMIEWDNGWRQYVFIQRIDELVKMGRSCEKQIADFLYYLMEQRKKC